MILTFVPTIEALALLFATQPLGIKSVVLVTVRSECSKASLDQYPDCRRSRMFTNHVRVHM